LFRFYNHIDYEPDTGKDKNAENLKENFSKFQKIIYLPYSSHNYKFFFKTQFIFYQKLVFATLTLKLENLNKVLIYSQTVIVNTPRVIE